MYETKLDSLVESIANDIYNHKRFRPKVHLYDKDIRHLLIPDVELYIFNFIFDSVQTSLDKSYVIDIISEKKYGSPYVYPLLTYINGYTGLQDLVQNSSVFLPNTLKEFANKFYDKYENQDPEKPVKLPEPETIETSSISSESVVSYLSQVFGELFVEAGG